VLIAYERAGEQAPSIQTAFIACIDELYAAGQVHMLIGPEGGFEEREVLEAEAAGAIVVTLGQRVLRSETAGLVASAQAMQALGELG
jgi:16S rRNA (uracil1498-N3)-methyltransferase